MTKRPSRVARVTLAAALGVAMAVGTTACSFSSLDHNVPGTGVTGAVGQAMVQNVVLVGEGTGARLVASALSSNADTLVSISGAPIKADGSVGKTFGTVAVNVAIPANSLVNLDSKNLHVSSPNLVVGLTANVTFNFAKAGAVTVVAPIASASNPVYAQTPAASS